MQSMIVMAIFALVLSIAGGIAIESGPSTQQLSRLQKEQTEEYFKALEIVLRDASRNNLEPAPNRTTWKVNFGAWIKNTPDLSQLSNGRWSDPTMDSWGTPIRGYMVRENRVLYANGSDQVMAVVSGLAFVSAGPDRVFQTPVPTLNSIASLQAVLPPLGSDDIVRVFTDESTQQENWEAMRVRMTRIANAVANDFQLKLLAYQNALTVQYQQQLQATGNAAMPDLDALLITDPNAPKYVDINVPANRLSLGVDDDFTTLEKTWDGQGNMKVTSITNPDGSVTLQLMNNPSSPTIWGTPSSSLKYSIVIKGSI